MFHLNYFLSQILVFAKVFEENKEIIVVNKLFYQ